MLLTVHDNPIIIVIDFSCKISITYITLTVEANYG